IDARLKPAPAADAHAGHGQAQASGHAGHGQAQAPGHHGQAEAAHSAYGATAAEITRGNTEARAVLTARQRTQLDALHARHHGAAAAECTAAPAAAHSHG
ncbi:MAG TPA: hypothetical protein VF625_11850, partial [Longimicrobium sp.]